MMNVQWCVYPKLFVLQFWMNGWEEVIIESRGMMIILLYVCIPSRYWCFYLWNTCFVL